jgi:hypothetical protein
MNKNSFFQVIATVFLVLIIGCDKSDNFKIEKGKVGKITTLTKMNELETIFKNDSIVKNLSEGALGDTYFQDDDEYLIFEKGGTLLLTVVPKEQLDDSSTIKSIEIHDNRFKTKNGISLESNFSEINASNSLRPESTLQSVTLFLDDLNATITIDKDELGIKDFITQKISLEQIPDLAKIKSFIIWFD